jgi:hypothetical protein
MRYVVTIIAAMIVLVWVIAWTKRLEYWTDGTLYGEYKATH